MNRNWLLSDVYHINDLVVPRARDGQINTTPLLTLPLGLGMREIAMTNLQGTYKNLVCYSGGHAGEVILIKA